jgi:phage tail-like protein
MRFHVFTSSGNRFLSLSDTLAEGKPKAGFSAMGVPSATVDTPEYREGHYIYTRKQPGIPTMDDITMSRGVTRRDTDFWDWLRVVIEGQGGYRTDLTIHHFAREGDGGSPALPRNFPVAQTNQNAQGLDLNSEARVLYRVFEAFPNSHRVSTDLDGTASDIAIKELGISYESFEVTPAPV